MKSKVKLYDKLFAHAHTMSNGYQRIEPDEFVWYRGKDYCHVSVFTDFSLDDVDKCDSPWKVALLMESPEAFPGPYEKIKNMYHKFSLILTFNQDLLDIIPNARKYCLGGSWIEPDKCQLGYPKFRTVSMIASDKATTSGHIMRHNIVDQCENMHINYFGDITEYHIPTKVPALRNFKYSIVVENCRRDNYFTEKLIDCFMTGTVPIYWGCPNIEKYFPRGVIQFETISELKLILRTLDSVVYPENHAIENYYRAIPYYTPENFIWKKYLKNIIEGKKCNKEQ